MKENFTLFITFLSAIGTARIIEVILRAWLKNKDFFKFEKRYLHDQILRICAEGSASSWQLYPRNHEHCRYVANCVKKYNEKLGSNLDLLVLDWSFYALLDPYSKNSLVDITNPFMKKITENTIKRIRTRYPRILEQANKIFLEKNKH